MRLDVPITARVTGHEEILRHEGNSIVASPGSVIVEFEGAQFPMNRRAFEAVCPDLIYDPLNQAYREPTDAERAAAEVIEAIEAQDAATPPDLDTRSDPWAAAAAKFNPDAPTEPGAPETPTAAKKPTRRSRTTAARKKE